jgi:hypothetical protein
MSTTDVSGDARQRVPVTTRYLALAGLIGPPLFASIIVLLTAIEWDFLHDLGWSAGPFDQPDSPAAWPSTTALGAYGFLQVLNFLVLGVSVLALAAALFRLFEARWTLGPSLLVLLAAGFATSAFRTDHGTATGAGPETWNGVTHAAALTVVFPTAVASMFVLAAQFRRDERWHSLSRYSLIAAVVTVASLTATLAGAGNIFFSVFLLVVFSWLSVIAAHALSLTRLPRLS